jgi:hypothetical protein
MSLFCGVTKEGVSEARLVVRIHIRTKREFRLVNKTLNERLNESINLGTQLNSFLKTN